MKSPIVICDHGFMQASLVPDVCLGPPGLCPPGVYDTLLWENGSAGDLNRHIGRFVNGCRFLGVNPTPWIQHLSREAVNQLAELNELSNQRARIRIMGFREPLPGNLEKPISFLAAMWDSPKVLVPADFRCIISSSRRGSENKTYQHKLLGLHNEYHELQEAVKKGYEDVLFLNQEDEVCETTYANFWMVKDNLLITPPVNAPCFPGITRDNVIRFAQHHENIFVSEQPVSCELLREADEIFLTSSIRGVQTVNSINGLWTGKQNRIGALLATILSNS